MPLKRERESSPNPRHNIPLRLLKETLPRHIPAQPHPLNLDRLKGIHRNTPHKTNMHTQPPMYTRTAQTNKDPELRGRPLRRRGPAVAAPVVLIGFLDLEELGGMLVNAMKGEKGEKRRRGEVPLIESLDLPPTSPCLPFCLTHSPLGLFRT